MQGVRAGLLTAAGTALIVLHAATARACDLALVLAIDVSVSVDAREYKLQMAGIARALRDPEVVAAIAATGPGGIRIALVQWSSFPYHAQSVDWTPVSDAASVDRLAAKVEGAARLYSRFGTGIGNALAYSAGLFPSLRSACRRRVIDVSGDGRNNELISPANVRDKLVGQGIVINGLAVLDGDAGLADYYRREVAGGSGSFVIEALTFGDFADAMKRKLLREILPALASIDASAPIVSQTQAVPAPP